MHDYLFSRATSASLSSFKFPPVESGNDLAALDEPAKAALEWKREHDGELAWKKKKGEIRVWVQDHPVFKEGNTHLELNDEDLMALEDSYDRSVVAKQAKEALIEVEARARNGQRE